MGRRLEDRLDALRAAHHTLRDNPTEREALTTIGRALGAKTGVVVERAADAVAELRLEAFADDVSAALPRLLDLPAKNDPMCRGKRALIEAMRVLPHAVNVRALRRAIGFVQLEPVYGGRVDTAPGVRGTASIVMVEQRIPDVVLDLVTLLVDPEIEARLLAVRAVSALGTPAAEVLLRHKALVGDEGDVMVEVLRGLLEVWPERSRAFVIGCLEAAGAGTREAAAIALGESRLEGLVEPLLGYAERSPEPGEYRVALIALGMLRDPEAVNALLDILGEAIVRDAVIAVEALAIQAHQPRVRSRVERLVEARGDRALREVFDDRFS